jgi:2-polyprenyl-6-methoxyphenol hydroxylase-like FAD-dependent oxidoreductase
MNSTVIVVGAGPVGLMLAAELGLAKVPVVLLERRTEPSTWSQAFGIHVSSADMFAQRGLNHITEGADRVHNYNFVFQGVTSMDEDLLPYLVWQQHVEQHLEQRVNELGITVQRGSELVGFEQDDTGVTATVRTADGEHQVRGAYLVGCDGGRSLVRKQSGIDFPGTSSVMCGRTGDMEVLNEEYQDGIGRSPLYPTGMAAIIRNQVRPGYWRVTVVEFDSERPSDDVPMTPEEFRAAFARVTGIDLKLGRTPWLTRFGDAARHATDYRRDRVFIAGDAAHVHFPSAGQGLNTGIQDAMNLGWKLAGAVNGWASEEVLDTYHEERHWVGREACVLPQAQCALLYPEERVGPLREIITELVQFDEVGRYVVGRLTGLGIHYPMKHSGRLDGTHPMLGYRVRDWPLTSANGTTRLSQTLHGGHGVVLDTSGGRAKLGELDSWRDRVNLVTAEPMADLPGAVTLIRPDGYVAFVDEDGTDEEGLRQALMHWFGKPN